jgi:hypothetical protein
LRQRRPKLHRNGIWTKYSIGDRNADDEWRRVMDVNVNELFWSCRLRTRRPANKQLYYSGLCLINLAYAWVDHQLSQNRNLLSGEQGRYLLTKALTIE